jgi:protein subunit release factor A
MKPYTLLTIAALALSSPLALAAGDGGGHPGHKKSSYGSSEAQHHIDQMQAHMQEMRKKMAEIRQIKDSDERKTRLRNHLRDMAKMMQEMRKPRPQTEASVHLQMVEKRVDLLQDLVNQMLMSKMMWDEGTFYEVLE